jgi:thioredoxin 1
MLKHINEENFEEEVLKSKDAILVDFFATWCGPCQMLGPVLEKIANSRADFNIAKIDVDQMPELAIKYGVEVVPTMVIFKDGKVMKTMEGVRSENEIVDEMSKYMEV